MFPMHVGDDLDLRPFVADDAGLVFALIERNRHRLDVWMRWTSRIQTLEDAAAAIERWAGFLEAGQGFHVGMWTNGMLIGGMASPSISTDSSQAEIGYWLADGYTGRGYVTRASRAVIDYLFGTLGLHRIEIQAVTENLPSRAVAERLGFTLEGIKRESSWVDGGYRDHALYSLLNHEWNTEG